MSNLPDPFPRDVALRQAALRSRIVELQIDVEDFETAAEAADLENAKASASYYRGRAQAIGLTIAKLRAELAALGGRPVGGDIAEMHHDN